MNDSQLIKDYPVSKKILYTVLSQNPRARVYAAVRKLQKTYSTIIYALEITPDWINVDLDFDKVVYGGIHSYTLTRWELVENKGNFVCLNDLFG